MDFKLFMRNYNRRKDIKQSNHSFQKNQLIYAEPEEQTFDSDLEQQKLRNFSVHISGAFWMQFLFGMRDPMML